MHHRAPSAAPGRPVAAPAVLPAVLLAVLSTVMLLAVPQAASAKWWGGGTGPAAAQATAVPGAAARPTSNRPFLSNTVTVSWSAATVLGSAVSGYVVTRYDGNGAVSSMTGGTCVGATRNTVLNVVAATTCTDERGFSGGTFTYRVRPVLERWVGPLSDPTTPAV